jgi:hypothetical protein
MTVKQQQPVLARHLCRHVPILWSERAAGSPSAGCVWHVADRDPRSSGVTRYYEANAKMVVELTVWPAFSSVEGKLGWLGEFGKCWVSNV